MSFLFLRNLFYLTYSIRSSRRCGNVRKRSEGRSCGKRCLRAVGKLAAFPSAERPFSTFPIAENSMIAYLYIAFPQERIYNELWLVNANYNSDSWRKLWEY